MRLFLALVLVAVLASTSFAQNCANGQCAAAPRVRVVQTQTAGGCSSATAGAVRTQSGPFFQRGPVRRLVTAPFRLVFGRCW